MPLRAIVFDFDGVIANSEPLHFRALRDVVADEGVALSERDYYGRYLGYDDVGALKAIASDHGRPWAADTISRLVGRKADRMTELEVDGSLLFPGAADAIRRLSAAVPMAVASGALREEIIRLLEHTHLLDAFVTIVGAQDTSASKPAPDPYLRAVALLAEACGGRLIAAECVAIEDSRWGLLSAKTAGLRTIGVTHTYPAAELSDADTVVNSLDAITLDLVRGLCRA